MENIRKKGVIGIVVCFIFFITFVIILINQNWEYAFQKEKEVTNIVELGECKEGDWIRLKFNRAYGTDYWYEKQGEQVARFIDIEVNGKALIALVERNQAEKILEGEEKEMYVEGILQTFQEPDMVNGYENIKQNYLEDFSTELTEEEILDLFTPMQLLSYGVEKPNFVFMMVLIIGTVGMGICLVIAVFKTVKPVTSRQKRMKEGIK